MVVGIKFEISKREELIMLALYRRDGSEMYGYQISMGFKKAGVKLSSGTLYPVLKILEEKGLVESRQAGPGECGSNGGNRKLYCLSQKGLDLLMENQDFRTHLLNWNPP